MLGGVPDFPCVFQRPVTHWARSGPRWGRTWALGDKKQKWKWFRAPVFNEPTGSRGFSRICWEVGQSLRTAWATEGKLTGWAQRSFSGSGANCQ